MDKRSSQAQYLLSIRKHKHRVRLSQISLLTAFLLLWQVSASLNLMDAFLLSSPLRMLASLKQLLLSGELFLHVGITLWETLLGFTFGTVLGLLLASLFWFVPFLNQVADPYLVILNALPKIALGPVIVVWLGVGITSIVVIALLVSVIVTLVTVLHGFTQTPKERLVLLSSFGAGRFTQFRLAVLPGALPSILSALKLNIGMTWIGVIVGEFLVSRAGLGYLIVYGGQVFKLDLVMASTCVLCLFAGGMYLPLAALERKLQESYKT